MQWEIIIFPCPLNIFTEQGNIPTRTRSYLFRTMSRETAGGRHREDINSLITILCSHCCLLPLTSSFYSVLLQTNIYSLNSSVSMLLTQKAKVTLYKLPALFSLAEVPQLESRNNLYSRLTLAAHFQAC